MSPIDTAVAFPGAARRPIRTRLALTVAGFGTLAVITCLLAPLVGTTTISLSRVFDQSIPFADNVDAQIFFVARLPRVLAERDPTHKY
jgi:ABC-type enterobactin transport system permease subunit